MRDRAQRAVDGVVVVFAGLPLPPAVMREASDGDDVAHAQRVEQDLVAGDEGDAQRALERPQARAVDAVDQDAAGARGVQPRDRAQQRRLSDAVRADDRDELAGRQPGVEPSSRTRPPMSQRDAAEFDHVACARRPAGRR